MKFRVLASPMAGASSAGVARPVRRLCRGAGIAPPAIAGSSRTGSWDSWWGPHGGQASASPPRCRIDAPSPGARACNQTRWWTPHWPSWDCPGIYRNDELAAVMAPPSPQKYWRKWCWAELHCRIAPLWWPPTAIAANCAPRRAIRKPPERSDCHGPRFSSDSSDGAGGTDP